MEFACPKYRLGKTVACPSSCGAATRDLNWTVPLLIALFLIVGCSKDDPTSPTATATAGLDLSGAWISLDSMDVRYTDAATTHRFHVISMVSGNVVFTTTGTNETYDVSGVATSLSTSTDSTSGATSRSTYGPLGYANVVVLRSDSLFGIGPLPIPMAGVTSVSITWTFTLPPGCVSYSGLAQPGSFVCTETVRYAKG